MSLNALLLASALSGEAEAKPIPEVTAAQIDRHCPAVSGATPSRGSVRENTGALNAIMQKVMEAPTKRQMVQALASELMGAVQREVPMDGDGEVQGIVEREGIVKATLADLLSTQAKVQANREAIQGVRTENGRDAHTTDLILNGLRPDRILKTIAQSNWESLRALYGWAIAGREAEVFKATAGVDCLRAFVTAQATGEFPAVEAARGDAKEPEWKLTVTLPAMPALKIDGEHQDWMLGLGREEEERVLAEAELAGLRAQLEKGLGRFSRRYDLADAEVPDLNLVVEFKEETAEQKK